MNAEFFVDRSQLLAPIQESDVERVDGPLVFVTGTDHVGWDEYVAIRLPDGRTRHGVVVDVDHDLAIVEVFEGTDGVGVFGNLVTFTGAPMDIPVSERWLGRISNGRGQPLDGGPPVTGSRRRAVSGLTINPAERDVPRDPVITGVSAIDGLATLVRGQKLPIFSVGGLPHLELAIQISAHATVEGADFGVIFAGIGLTNSDADLVREGLEERVRTGEAALFINTADDPTMERILTPRVALTVAEHLAFDLGRHVLVVLTDMTSYCDAVRQLSAARGEVPGRRGYPGYLFSDLASIYERCGRIAGRPGSITELPVLTMPAGDITHPVPDLTGYITEGQVVLSTDLHTRSVSPPIDVLASLSRSMRRGAGPGRTRDDHLAIASQVLALLALARRAQELASLIGVDALSMTERRYLEFAERFEHEFINQGRHRSRSMAETLDIAWQIATIVPQRELTMLTAEQIRIYGNATSPIDGAQVGSRPCNAIASTPTRAGRLRILARLETARHAADLLRNKEEALDRERARLEGHTARAEADWRRHCSEALTWLVRARTLGASDEINAAIGHTRQPATVTPRWQSSMGIVYPGSVECVPGATAPLSSTAALGPATEAYRRALDAGATCAATTAAVNRLDTELAATRRRRRAIEDRLQPRLEATLRELDVHLDELDREEAHRVHVAIELQPSNHGR